jgi:hypothetical protein
VIRLPLTAERLIEGYYRPFRTWLLADPGSRVVEFNRRDYLTAPVTSVNLWVGLETGQLGDEIPDTRRVGEHPDVGEDRYFGRDGVLVSLGPAWVAENMTLEPQERVPQAAA